MFQGLDAAEVEALAVRMGEGADGLDQVFVTTRALLYAAPWSGVDADTFRQSWDGPLRLVLMAAAADLRVAASQLQGNATDQRAASDEAGGALAGGSGWVDKFADLAWDAVELAAHIAATSMVVQVASHIRAGEAVSGYVRWKAGTAARMKGLVGPASDMARVTKLVRVGGFAIDFTQSAIEQTKEDAGKYATSEQYARTLGGGIAGGALSSGTTTAFMLAGSAIAPGVGTVVGLAIGTGVTWAFDEFGVSDKVTDFGAWAGSALYAGAEDLVDFGGDVFDAGRDVWDAGVSAVDDAIDTAANAVGGAVNAVGDFVDDIDLTPW